MDAGSGIEGPGEAIGSDGGASPGGPGPTGGAPVLEGEAGQTTAEYALVLLGAAAVALLLLAWASRTGAIGDLLDFIVDQIVGRVT